MSNPQPILQLDTGYWAGIGRGLWYRLISRRAVYLALSTVVLPLISAHPISFQFATRPSKHLPVFLRGCDGMQSMETSASAQLTNHCTIASRL